MSDGIVEKQGTGSSEDEPIFRRRRKKRRKRAYVDFAAVAQIFPEASTNVMCQLSEMMVIKPSNVLELVPGATTAQIASCLEDLRNWSS